MSVIEKSIEINVPVRAAYNQWTQFEEFPRFMEGVKQVKQIDDKHLHWKADIGGTGKRMECRDHRTGSRPAYCLDESGGGIERRRCDLSSLN